MTRPGRARAIRSGPVGAGIFIAAVLGAASPTLSQKIIQVAVLDLTVLDVQVIVTGARGEDQVQCLLRDAAGRVRVGGVQRVSTGSTTGPTTVVSVPLPVLNPQESEFAVTLVRGDTVLDRTAWRRFVRKP